MMKTICAASLALLLFSQLGCSNKNEFQAPPPPEVSVQHPEQKDVTVFATHPGRLAASDSVEIRARVKGFLKSIDFTDGQQVEKGDLLFTIEPDEFQAALRSAEAKLAQAKASLKLADSTLKRKQQAYRTKAVSELDLLGAEADMQAAEAAIQAADAAVSNAQLNLSYTRIHAPLSGRLARRTLSVGNLVGDGGSTLLTTLVVGSPIDVFFNVDERTLLPFLQEGALNNTAGKDTPPVQLGLADGTLHDELGTINYFDPAIDPDTGTLRARAVFPNKKVTLLPGLYGEIKIPKTYENAILAPDLSIQRDIRGFYVLVVNATNKVESRYIKRGELVDTNRIIEDGLTVEDRIIIEGVQRARPGIQVKVSPSNSN
jgi:RND family efflux transporter MFP subunit